MDIRTATSTADPRQGSLAATERVSCLILRCESLGDRIYPLRGVVTIGRRADRAIQVADSRVSSEHAEVFERGGSWWIRDLEASSGTTVNGQIVRGEQLLRSNDRIELGGCPTKLFFREDRQPLTTTASPAAATPTLTAASLEREVERRVVLRIAETERLARDRHALLNMAAHDLKTPLSGILGYVDALEQRVRDEPDLEWVADELGVVSAAARGMMELLTDLLDRQKAEAGRLELVLQETDLSQFLREACEIYHRWASGADRRVNLKIEGPLPPLRMDGKRLTQILNNLVHNALKHTPRGRTTTIEARALPGRIEIAVANEGKGFDPSETDRMLAHFVRGTANEAPVGEGHGLGLAIVDKLVTLVGGALKVDGKVGKGARFSFSLPLRGPARD